MKIALHSVVTFDYTLKNSEGQLLDTSDGREPLVYLHGVGALIPGLENQLQGLGKGDKKKVEVLPEHAYGDRREDLMREVPKAGFQSAEAELQEGMQVELDTEQGAVIARVVKIEGEKVMLDLNHPLAGMTLLFDVDIKEIRQASDDEIQHGHVHGPGGHQH